MMNDVYAIIVAAGRGSRFGSDLPKQFCPLAGRPLLMTSIERMAEAVGLDRIILVLDPAMEPLWREMCSTHNFKSPRIVYGGATRLHSVYNALLSIPAADATVMIHDGARPLASVSLLRRMSRLPAEVDGMIPAVPVTDSLRELDGEGSKAVDRSRYVAVQTPQTFLSGRLREAYAAIIGDSSVASSLTDDASVMEAAGHHKILLAEGEPTNIKVTNPLDLAIAETILNSLNR